MSDYGYYTLAMLFGVILGRFIHFPFPKRLDMMSRERRQMLIRDGEL